MIAMLDQRPEFASMAELYEKRGGRRSPECDLGVWWLGARPLPRYRLTWVEDTGDLVTVDQQSGSVILLAVIPPAMFPEPPSQRFVSLDRDESRPLFGWADQCGRLGGLQWVIEQTREWAP